VRTDVCAVVLTYQPEMAALEALVARIVPQVASAVIVDNGSDAAIRAGLANVVARFPSARTICLETNLGVAAGHNRGIAAALEKGCAFVLILDQDSLPSPDMVAELAEGYRRAAETAHKVAAVGPRYVQTLSGEPFFFVQLGRVGLKHLPCTDGELIRSDLLISSGCLIAAAAIREVGWMREELFIDYVDTDWFLRARQRGWTAYGVCSATMEHRLGERTLRLWLGSWREIALHSPLRHYYQFRNSVYLFLRSSYPLRWKAAEARRRLKMLVVLGLLLPDRATHVKKMLCGIRDGVRGRMGRRQE
jgi:rhamnosyltransferase